jgi:DNA-binding GntR family transcriptional regulator
MTDVRAEPALLPETIYAQLRTGIVTGQIAGGTPLSVPRLASELGVSRSPAREAIQRLIAEGLAMNVPYAGARVRALDPEGTREVFVVREVLDALAAGLAATQMGAQERAALGDVLAEQEANLERPVDQARDASLDIAFHGAIRAGSGNGTLNVSLERIEAIAHLQGSRLWTSDEGRRLAVQEHRTIWEAVAARDSDRARDAAAAHVRAVAERLAEL